MMPDIKGLILMMMKENTVVICVYFKSSLPSTKLSLMVLSDVGPQCVCLSHPISTIFCLISKVSREFRVRCAYFAQVTNNSALTATKQTLRTYVTGNARTRVACTILSHKVNIDLVPDKAARATWALALLVSITGREPDLAAVRKRSTCTSRGCEKHAPTTWNSL